jgi:hypothetical protein
MNPVHRRSESGQSIIVIAFIVMVILALLALVVDVGNAYAQRRVLQNAVDAAAIAGATKLSERGSRDAHGYWTNPVTDRDIKMSMDTYARDNGVDPDSVEMWYVDKFGDDIAEVGSLRGSPAPHNAMGVRVEGNLSFATYFAHLLGFEDMTVSAPSHAYVLTGPCSGTNLFPMAVNINTFPNGVPQIGETYTMLGGSPNPHNDNFWWVHWDPRGSNANYQQGPSSQALDWNLADPSRSNLWRTGNWVQRSQGVQMDSQTRCLLEGRINGNGTLASDCNASMPSIVLEPEVIIPIFDSHSTACPAGEDPETCGQAGNTEGYRIVGFAKFHMTCYYHSNTKYAGNCSACDGASNKCATGYFVDWVDEPFEDGCMETGASAPSYRRPSPTMTPLP